MAKLRGDNRTLELLDWEPPQVAVRFEPRQVQAATLSHRISRAVSTVLKESGKSRDEVAAAMGEFLGREVSRSMLDAYASEARETHEISLSRAIALSVATGDVRLLAMGLEMMGYAVIEERYLDAIEDAMCEDVIERVRARQRAARRRWKGGRP